MALTQPANVGLGRLTPAANADTQGMFGPKVAWPIIPLHAVLTPTGHLVTYGSPVNKAAQGALTFVSGIPRRVSARRRTHRRRR